MYGHIDGDYHSGIAQLCQFVSVKPRLISGMSGAREPEMTDARQSFRTATKCASVEM